MEVGIIDSHSGIFNRFEFDAIVGMSFKYAEPNNYGPLKPTFMDEIKA